MTQAHDTPLHDTGAHLIRMANQIAANLAAQGHDVAVRETAQHITLYWEPRMKAAIVAADPKPLSPIARAAIALIATPAA